MAMRKISITSSTNDDIAANTAVEEEAKWRQLSENHHEHCDLEKCRGKQINGLYACQFSNIPGSVYSQYLRHRRRNSAYKTKPCRNHFGINGFCRAGDLCPFYHSAEEKREPPPQLTASLDCLLVGNSNTAMDGGSSSSGSSSTHNLNTFGNGGAANFPIGHFGLGGRQQQQSPVDYFFHRQHHQQEDEEEQQHKHAMLDKLIWDVQSVGAKMFEYTNMLTNRENIPPPPEQAFVYQPQYHQQYQVPPTPRNSPYPAQTAAGFHQQQQQHFFGNFPVRRQSMGGVTWSQQQPSYNNYSPQSFNHPFGIGPIGHDVVVAGGGGFFSRAVGGDLCFSQAAQLRSAANKGMKKNRNRNGSNSYRSAVASRMAAAMAAGLIGSGVGGDCFSKSFHPFSESYPLGNPLTNLLPKHEGGSDEEDEDNTFIVTTKNVAESSSNN